MIISAMARIFREGKYPPLQWKYEGIESQDKARTLIKTHAGKNDRAYVITTEKITVEDSER